ncbi:MAG: glycoside hydrolase family 3 protein [Candidatus Saccharimonadales bacterium]
MATHSKKTAKRKTSSKHRTRTSGYLRNRKLRVLFPLLIVALLGLAYYINRGPSSPPLPSPPADALYRQSSQPIEARVDDLLSRMTLDEKIGQMALVDKNSLKKTVDISRYNLGGILSGAGAKPSNNTPHGWVEMVSEMKKQAQESRLGIPILYGVDANHGNGNVPVSTIFPHAIGLGAANDSELTTSVATATAQEVIATGINWSYSPSLDAPLDIRWGRVYEAFSDNPALNATQGAAYIKGVQQTSVLATAKHFLATGSMTWGQSKNKKFQIDQGVIPAHEELLDSHYLVPYAAASQADVASVMVGLSFWGDKRVIANKHLITDKLKNQLGYKGFVVSDWYGMYEFSGKSKYEANIETINAGVDMAMLPYDYKDFVKDVNRAVQKEAITHQRIDDAVRRILYQKFNAGLFDAPRQNQPGLDTVGSPQNRDIARQAVAASSVLLKNNDELLPLAKNADHILVAGSGADNVGRQAGAWTIEWQGINGNYVPGGTSILQGLRQTSPGNKIDYDANANFASNIKADVGIAVVGEKPYAEGFGDNPNPSLDEADKQVIERLKERSNKVIVIVISGRPLLMTDQIKQADALVAAWLPGSEGTGIADVLFGDKPFKAKLPLLWPTGLHQIPTTVNGKTADGSAPLFDRGFGLAGRP